MLRESKSTPQPAAQTTTETAKAADGRPQKFTSEGAIPSVFAGQPISADPTASEKAFDPPAPAPETTRLAALDTGLTRIERVLARPNPTRVELEAVRSELEALEAVRDSLSEVSEEQSLRMQMYMDRMSKADSMISNMLKKFSETSSGIVANMK